MLRLLLVILSSVLLVSSARAFTGADVPAAALPPLRAVTLGQEVVAPGGEQSLVVSLTPGLAATTILRLRITYADGTTQEVLDQTLGSTATLTWQVPEGTPGGRATFELTSSGCGCGDRSSATQAADRESSLAGTFEIID
jgi:hypothetical protein